MMIFFCCMAAFMWGVMGGVAGSLYMHGTPVEKRRFWVFSLVCLSGPVGLRFGDRWAMQ